MDQFKFSLGPYELFSAIIGGIPLFLAGALFYNPVSSLQELVPIVQKNGSIANVLVILFISYILGETTQGLTWQYFKRLCKILNKDYRYFGNLIQEKNSWLMQQGNQLDFTSLTFEEQLVLLVREKVGMPKESSWLDSRLTAYLREHNKQATLTVTELHLATHIMYRTWSFGFCVLSIVLLINLFRTSTHPLEQWMLPILSLFFARLTLFRALCFKQWHNREILLGFYFAAVSDTCESQSKSER